MQLGLFCWGWPPPHKPKGKAWCSLSSGSRRAPPDAHTARVALRVSTEPPVPVDGEPASLLVAKRVFGVGSAKFGGHLSPLTTWVELGRGRASEHDALGLLPH